MAKKNVTNKHDALLNVAGVDIRPGATAAVDETDLKTWATGYAAKLWIEGGIVEIGGASGGAAKAEAPASTEPAKTEPARVDRAAYLAKAKELKLDLPANISNTNLAAAVHEAEAKKAQA